MIRDRKGGPFGWVIERYVARKVRRAFRGVWQRGSFPANDRGLLIYANHTSFWDGFVIHQLGQAKRWDGYALMEEKNVAKYPFHSRIGAISIKPGDASSTLQTVRYVKQVLKRPGAAVVVFPEGVSRPGAIDVGTFARGIEVLARATRARCVPMAMRYAFLEHEYPDVLLEVGPAHDGGELEEMQADVGALHQRLMAVRSLEGFTRVIAGRSSVQERWDTARTLGAGGTTVDGGHR